MDDEGDLEELSVRSRDGRLSLHIWNALIYLPISVFIFFGGWITGSPPDSLLALLPTKVLGLLGVLYFGRDLLRVGSLYKDPDSRLTLSWEGLSFKRTRAANVKVPWSEIVEVKSWHHGVLVVLDPSLAEGKPWWRRVLKRVLQPRAGENLFLPAKELLIGKKDLTTEINKRLDAWLIQSTVASKQMEAETKHGQPTNPLTESKD